MMPYIATAGVCRVARLGLLVLLGRDVLNSLVQLPNYYQER